MGVFWAMQAAAERLGWKLSPPDPGLLDAYTTVTLSGVESGVPIFLERRASVYSFTTIGVIEAPLPSPALITQEGVRGRVANLVGFEDVQIGDAAFDATFRIVSEDVSFVTRLLNPDLRQRIWALHEATKAALFRGFQISEGAVSVERMYPANMILPEDIVADIKPVADMVHALKEAAAQPYR